MCRCVVALCTQINRTITSLLSLLGFSILVYGVFVLSQASWSPSIFPLSVAGWGGVLFVCTLTYATCGYKSACCNRMYTFIMFVFFAINAVGSAYFFTHKDQTIHYLNKTLVDVPKGVLDPSNIQTTVTYTLYGIAGLSGVVLLSAILAVCQRSALIDSQSYNYDDDEIASYSSYTSDPLISSSPSKSIKRRSDLDRAVQRSEATVAANRFREKYSDMYDKYNIQVHS